MPKIKFLADYTVKAAGGPTYKKGQVVEMSQESCDHFVNRQPPRAELVDDKGKKLEEHPAGVDEPTAHPAEFSPKRR